MTKADRSLLATLKQLAAFVGPNLKDKGYAYSSTYDFVAKEGRACPIAGTHDYPMREKRDCFNNSLVTAATYGLRYVEGFAISEGLEGLPIHHAWNLDEDGNVVDTTWDQGTGVAYRGTVFPISMRFDNGSVLDNWQDHYSLYKTKWHAPKEEA